MTTTSEMVFEVKCLKCGTVYRSELAHVGKSIQCGCGSLLKIIPPLKSLIDVAPTPTRGASTKLSTRKLILRIAVAGAVMVAFVVFSVRFTSEKGRPAGQSGTPQVMAEQPMQREPTVETPDVRPTTYHTLATGTRLDQDVRTDGHGKLTVENGTDEDAAVRLYDSRDDPVRSFFVEAHSTGRVARIPEGPYRLAFTTGLDYVESDDSFRWHPEYFDFEKTFVFVEQSDSEGIRYKTVNVTLHPVFDGNIQRRSITREQFLKGHHHSVAIP